MVALGSNFPQPTLLSPQLTAAFLPQQLLALHVECNMVCIAICQPCLSFPWHQIPHCIIIHSFSGGLRWPRTTLAVHTIPEDVQLVWFSRLINILCIWMLLPWVDLERLTGIKPWFSRSNVLQARLLLFIYSHSHCLPFSLYSRICLC